MADLKVTAVELTSINSYSENISKILHHLNSIPTNGQGNHLVCFPENCLYFRLSLDEKIPFIDINDPLLDSIAELAVQKNIHILLGSVPLRISNRNYSAMVLIDPSGSRTSPYQKIHLFDLNLSDLVVRESEVFSPGLNPAVIDIGGWRIGLSICFDIRFSYLYDFYKRNTVDAIVIPSAFTFPTGKAHWEILVRARAIETQSYVIAAGQSGDHLGKRKTWGQSMIVSPWGEILAQANENQKVIEHILLKSEIQSVRQKIPMNRASFFTD